MYQLSRLMRGNARSFAPTMIGMRKLPSVAGIDGIRKKKTIMTPCIVKSLLYVSGCTRSAAGVSSSRRMISANDPPRKKKAVIETEVQQRDPLVVAGQQPRLEAVAVVQIVQAGCGGVHSVLTSVAPVRALASASRPGPRCGRTRRHRLHVRNQLQQLFLGHEALERRHDRLEARDNLG